MLENQIFGFALLLGSLLFMFHGCVLLFSPSRYLPMYTWGQSTIILVRKPPFEFWKRLGGLLLSAAIFLVFTLPAISMVFVPKGDGITSGNSPLPRDTARWDMLGLGLFSLLCGYILLFRPQSSVEMMFSADKSKLQDATTRKLWTLYVRLGGACILAWSLLPMGEFIKSLR